MINEREIEQSFARAMEQGGPSCGKEIIEKRKAILDAFNDYLEEVEKHYFMWGYRQALEDMKSMKDE